MEKYRMITKFDEFVRLVEIQDFDLLITFAIGSRHTIHQDISVIYKENHDYFYELFKKSPYYRDQRLASLSVENYQAIQQFIGIYLHERSLNINNFTMKLIKKGYRFVYNFVKNKKNLDFYELRDGYLDYVLRNNFDKTIHSAHLFGVALYLCKVLKKEILYEEFDLNLVRKSVHQIFIEKEFKPEITIETEEFLKQYQTIGLNKKDFQLPLNNLVTSINNVHRQQIAKEKNLDPDEDMEQLNRMIKDHNFYKALSKIGIILQFCKIDPIDLQNITSINYSKMKELISVCFESNQILDMSEDLYSLLGTYLVIYALATDYNNTKHNLIITAQEETHHELVNLKREYEGKISSLQNEEDNNNAAIRRLTASNHSLLASVQTLERQLKKKDIAIHEQDTEILSLRTALDELHKLNNEPDSKVDSELTDEEMAEFINQKKCVVVGGHKNWQDHLKNYLPACRFITPDELSIDVDFLLTVDLVLFNETINNHSMYQKVKSKLVHTDVPICYNGSNTNIKISLQKMYAKLKDL